MNASEFSKNNIMEKIVSLCKRRGFIFPGSEIYSGLANSWDFGHAGTELFNNISALWWKRFVQERPDMLGIRGPVLMNPKVWEASGHVKNFTDPLVECRVCHARFRADKEKELKEHANEHKEKDIWTESKLFSLLVKTFLGPVEDQQLMVYLRGELAQTMFTDFKIMLETNRRRLPFGIAQIGKVFRNEVTAGNFIFRSREFHIAELEYFVKPGKEDAAFYSWAEAIEKFLTVELGLKKENLRRYEHPQKDLAHYSKGTIDFQYRFPWGLASRTDYDLKNHEQLSGQNLKYKDPESGEEFWPYVVEPSVGLERLMLAVLLDGYTETEARSGKEDAVHETEVVLRLKKSLSPVKVAVLPLSKKENLSNKAKEIYLDLLQDFACEYDETQSIGKRYRRQDEIGTPYCVTVDFESLEDNAVTVRDRDTMKQERIAISDLKDYLKEKLK
jgi:glycyl-tRNA synthetase